MSDQVLTRGHWIVDHIRAAEGTSRNGVTNVHRVFG